MRITVLGATGTIGTRIAEHLTAAGHEVVRAGRSTGVDASTGEGLDGALAGAEAVVDCVNIETLSSRKAVAFFSTTARNVATAARRAGTGRIVCVSIAGATDPKINRGYGYYRGKAAQEHVYRSSGVPVTLIHSTQWFELIADIVRRTTLGPVAVLPTMKMAAVAADSVARMVVAEAVRDAPAAVHELAVRGPEVATGKEIARAILAARGSIDGRQPRVLAELPYFGLAIATGGLIPGDALTDDVTVRDWLKSGDV